MHMTTDIMSNLNLHCPIANHIDACWDNLLARRSTLRCSDPEYYNSLYGIIGTVFQSAILLAGVLGNMMVVITVRGTKSLHTTTNCYLVSLALADLITLLSSVPQEVTSNYKTKYIFGSVFHPVK